MSRTIYLARLWSAFCRDGGAGPRRAFSDREAAEKWAAGTPPIDYNPFLGAYQDEEKTDNLEVGVNPETEGLSDGGYRSVSLKGLEELVHALGLTPPAREADEDGWYEAERVWADWWNAECGSFTDAQKAALWRFLMPMPYQIVAVELEG